MTVLAWYNWFIETGYVSQREPGQGWLLQMRQYKMHGRLSFTVHQVNYIEHLWVSVDTN
jgi:hypothetical protein